MPMLDLPQMRDAVPERVRELVDRMVTTAAEAALLALGSETLAEGQVNLFDLDLERLAGYALGGALLSLLFNLARGGLRGRRASG